MAEAGADPEPAPAAASPARSASSADAPMPVQAHAAPESLASPQSDVQPAAHANKSAAAAEEAAPNTGAPAVSARACVPNQVMVRMFTAGVLAGGFRMWHCLPSMALAITRLTTNPRHEVRRPPAACRTKS